jgi:hypothetical protein
MLPRVGGGKLCLWGSNLEVTVKRYVLVSLVVMLGLAVAAPAGASATGHARAHAAKKCKKKRGAASAKKCKRKKPAPVTPTPTPATPTTPTRTPLPLTAAEVINRVIQQAGEYCAIDPDCVAYGYYYDTAPGDPACVSRSTYTWTCYGWNDEGPGFTPPNATCDFREIVSRNGYDGITSQFDTSFGGSGGPGWDCYVV